MKENYVENCRNGMKLSTYIKKLYPSIPNNYLYKAIRNKDIKINGTRIGKDVLINNGDKLCIYINDNILFNLPKNLDIIYQDENILAVYKPQGILSNCEDNSTLEPTLDDLVKNINSNTKICHRLDRNTAGIVIFSKNNNTYNLIQESFKQNYINKKYLAYVHGTYFKKDSQILEKYILTDKKVGFSKIFDNKVPFSKKIITEYKVIAKDVKLNYSILEVIIHTGKTHQIRAQLANIGHPVIGDQKYGKNEINEKFKLKKQLLFAYEYTFNFDNKNPLNYLNDIVLKLDNEHLKIRFGCDINE